MVEIVQRVSIVVMWIAVAMNLWSFCRSQRMYKVWKAHVESLQRLIDEIKLDHVQNVNYNTDKN